MRLQFVRDARGREEEIAALVAVSAAALGAAWLRAGLPTPRCVFHALTGVPCVTCGATRSFRSLLNGEIFSAILWNPLVALGAITAGILVGYAIVVALFRLPRARIREVSKGDLRWMRALVVTAVAANWIYLGFRFAGGW